ATGQQQLPMGLAPFAQAQVVEKVLPTPAAQLVLGQRLALLLESTPEIDEGRKIGVFIPPLGMGLIGRLLTFDRSFPRVLHRQGAGNDQHLVQTAEPGCFHQHPADARVHRQPRQLPAFLSDAAVPLDRTELLQEVEAVTDGAAFRWLDEGEILDPAQPQMQHLQDHRRQVGTQDLRVGKGRAAVEVLFAVQAHADTGRHPTATSLALVRAGLRYRLDRQPLYLRTRTVTADAHLTGVDHVDDTRHGKRGLRHVGRQDHTPTGVAGEDLLLFGYRQPCIQRQDLGVSEVGLAQEVRRVPDLPLAGQEHQRVAGRLAGGALVLLQFAQRRQYALIDTQVFFYPVAVLVHLCCQWPVPDVHREGASRDLDYRGIVEVGGKTLQVDGRRGDDDLEVRPLRQNGLQIAEQKVDIQAALVRLIDDQRVISRQVAVILG